MCERGVCMLALLASIALSTAALAERRDPLRPADYRPAAGPEAAAAADDAIDPGAWTLSSTLVSSQRRVAIINGLAVRTGERVAGARVLGIETNLVRLEIDGRPFTVRRAASGVRVTRKKDRR